LIIEKINYYFFFPLLDLLGHTCIRKALKEVMVFEYAKRNMIAEYQLFKLRKLLRHSYENVPYYKRLFKEIKLINFEKFSFDDLKSIPKLTKKIIKNNELDLKSLKTKNIYFKKASTGGSSGEPLRFLLDLNSWSYSWANNFRGWGYINYKIGDKMMVLGSSSLFENNKKSKEQFLLHKIWRFYPYNGMNMSDDVCRNYTKFIKEKKIMFLYGYSSSIFLLAKYIQKNKIKIKLKGVIPTSEISPPYYKQYFSEVFNCKVVDSYGASDGGITANQCEYGNFHLSESCIVINEGNINPGKILVTDLHNYIMPFINYEVGDIMFLSDEMCKCGRNQFLAKEILGRENSIMEFYNGKKITGPGWTILFKDRNINKYRMIQLTKKSILLEIETNKFYSKNIEEKLILSSLKRHIGNNVDIRIKYINKLEYLKNGKASYFISKK